MQRATTYTTMHLTCTAISRGLETLEVPTLMDESQPSWPVPLRPIALILDAVGLESSFYSA